MDGTSGRVRVSAMLLYNILRSLNLFHQLCVSVTIFYEIFYVAVHLRSKFSLFVCMWVLSHQPETLVTTAFSVLLTLPSFLMDVPVKVGVGTFSHILATI